MTEQEDRTPSRRERLFGDLLTSMSLFVFVILLMCVLVAAWLYESGF